MKTTPFVRLLISFRWLAVLAVLAFASAGEALSAGPSGESQTPAAKQASAFFPPRLIAQARANTEKHAWAARIRDGIVVAAQPWMKLSDDQLWDLMFGNTIKRSWMVWSNGYCPACKKGVPMYNWDTSALERPWKVQCPHCRELFPKNNFQRFYESGLDRQRVFRAEKADRSLLFNAEHPDPADPLYQFGVDDGEGFVEGENRWRFIGAYLIYGQWKQAIVAGITNLAAAHVVTGDPGFAHKAGVLLDRAADLYPTFDFGREGVMYEGPPAAGYVSTWHDACREAHDLALAYDAVFEALAKDCALVDFLAAKAKQSGLGNAKASFADIQRNIEDRILRDTLANRKKIKSNYPATEATVAAIETVLGWPDNREQVYSLLDEILKQATAVDGVSGEKGMTGYTTIAPGWVAQILGRYGRMDPKFLSDMLARHPRLYSMYRFHIDTWCLDSYYPQSGDTGVFGAKVDQYAGVSFSRKKGIEPSDYAFLWDLYEQTGDKDFVRVLYRANGNSVKSLPHDLFAADPAGFQERVQRVIAQSGTDIRLPSVNKREWRLAILRSGRASAARALWLDYDSGGRHGHADAMNLGLFGLGLDLMPDFGYPPVQFGGWRAPRAVWYTLSSAHNTVVVDRQNSRSGAGAATLWADGEQFHAVRASGPGLIGGQQFERTAVLVDLGEDESYVIDLFRVVGGKEHVKFFHSGFGTIATQGLSLVPADDFGSGSQMRGMCKDSSAGPGWTAEWTLADPRKYLPPGAPVHLRYTDLTPGAEAMTADGWVSLRDFSELPEAWIPRLLIRRASAEAPLVSTFVSVIEPYRGKSRLGAIRRLPLAAPDGKPYPESHVALEIRHANGGRDVLVAADVENPLGQEPSLASGRQLVEKENRIRLEGELCVVRFDAAGRATRALVCRAKSLEIGSLAVRPKSETDCAEIHLVEAR